MLSWVRRALHTLFKGVNQGSQLGHFGQHLFQGATVLATWVHLTHLVFARLGKEGEPSVDQARDCRVDHPEQEAKHLMGGVDPQPNEGQQELVTHRQGEGVSSTRSTLTLGRGVLAVAVVAVVAALLLVAGIDWAHVGKQGRKLREFQASDSQKHSWIAL